MCRCRRHPLFRCWLGRRSCLGVWLGSMFKLELIRPVDDAVVAVCGFDSFAVMIDRNPWGDCHQLDDGNWHGRQWFMATAPGRRY